MGPRGADEAVSILTTEYIHFTSGQVKKMLSQTLSLGSGSGMRILPFSSRRMSAYATKNLSANHVASMPFAHGASRSRNVLARSFAHQPQQPQQGKLLQLHREPRRFAMNDASTAAATVAKRATISGASVGNGQVEITWGDASKDIFSAVWLRDHCKAEVSWDSLTNQKLVDTHIIPASISARSIAVISQGRELRVEWDTVVQSVEASTYDAAWLYSHRHGVPDDDYVEPNIWGASDMQDVVGTISVPYRRVMSDEAGLLDLLHLVRVHGVAFVSETPHSRELSQKLVERMGPIQQTIYGGFWETVVKSEDDVNNIDSAYSTVALPAHTDGNYFEDTPGLQIFHCLKQDASGGQTLLVDGFRAAEKVKGLDPDAFDILTRTKVAYQHKDAFTHIKACHPTIGLDPWGRFESIHFNNLDRDAVLLPRGEVDAFYRAWGLFTEQVKSTESEVWIKLSPGNLVVIDNRRVMHGRSAFSSSSGRTLVGCYISSSDFKGKYRHLSAKRAQGLI